MRIGSLIKSSLAQFRVNLVRTFLALLGIIFGVSSVIAMITIGEGAQREILENINAMGADLVHIQDGDIDKSQLSQIVNESTGLSFRDVEALKTLIPMVGRDVAGFTRGKVKTTNLPLQANELNVFAISRNFLQVSRLPILAGRNFSDSDFSGRAAVAVVSEKMATTLYITPEQALGKKVRLNTFWFDIIGVFGRSDLPSKRGSRKGFPKDYGIFEQSILLPYSTVEDKVAAAKIYSPLDKILLKGKGLLETNRLKLVADRILGLTHNKVRDYKIFSPQELLDQQQSTQEIFNIVLLSIASISLLVGGIGIMNIMLANVLERKTEIGIRRALGARKRDIIYQFLFEAVAICLIGGVLGVTLGLGIALGIMKFTSIPISFSLKPVLISFLISFSVGVIFGIMPAREAANLNPVEALHDE